MSNYETSWLHRDKLRGYSATLEEHAKVYAEKLAKAIPGAFVREAPTAFLVKKAGNKYFTVWDLLENEGRVRDAFGELNRALRRAAGDPA